MCKNNVSQTLLEISLYFYYVYCMHVSFCGNVYARERCLWGPEVTGSLELELMATGNCPVWVLDQTQVI